MAKIKSEESETTAVQSILPKIITNSLSRAISWAGAKTTKIAFNESKTYEVIQGNFFYLMYYCTVCVNGNWNLKE